MKKKRFPFLIHGIVETGEVRKSDRSEVLDAQVAFLRKVLERALILPRYARTEFVSGGWRIAARTSFPGGRLAVRLYAPGMDPAGACAASMSVSYAPGTPPALWTSRAGISLAPDSSKAATEIRNLELGFAWAWIPLIEEWGELDWARTLDVSERVLEDEHGGGQVDEMERYEQRAEKESERHDISSPYEDTWEDYDDHDPGSSYDDYDPEPYGDPYEDIDPWEWAPDDVKEDWSRDEHGGEAGWDFLDEWDE